jgi:excinuclease UvrABC nuclease subunit
MKVKNYAEIIQSKQPIPSEDKKGGIYFLIQDEEIVYVGKSEDYIKRISTHQKESKKVFDSFSVLQISDSLERDVTEAFYIVAFSPKYNSQPPQKHHLTLSLVEMTKSLRPVIK